MLRKVDKISKILAVVLLVVMLVTMVTTTVFADEWNVNVSADRDTADATSVTNIGGKIVGIVQVVGYVIAVVMLVMIGIKYITSSPDGKAEVKKTALFYVLGAVLIAAATTIVKMVFDFGVNADAK